MDGVDRYKSTSLPNGSLHRYEIALKALDNVKLKASFRLTLLSWSNGKIVWNRVGLISMQDLESDNRLQQKWWKKVIFFRSPLLKALPAVTLSKVTSNPLRIVRIQEARIPL